MSNLQDDDGYFLGIVREFSPSAGFGFVDFAEKTGSLFFHGSRIVGLDPTPGAPVRFRVEPHADNSGRIRTRAVNVERLCPFDYHAGDALEPAAIDATQTKVETGIVRQFDLERGYGFIAPDGSRGSRVFFHQNEIRAAGLVSVEIGDHLRFVREARTDRNGRVRWRAMDIERLPPKSASAQRVAC
jgi:cold shock CspA family protein